jgi:toxin ParE1/3/4
MFPVVHKDIYRMLVRRFPFGIFYRIEDTVVIVIAVFHASRDPFKWKER